MRRLLIAVALMAGVAIPAQSVAFGATTTQTIKGRLVASSGSPQNYRIAFIAPRGSSQTVTLTSAGTFTFTVPKALLYGGTLQLIRPNGQYAGPITLARDSLTKASSADVKRAKIDVAAHTQFSGVGVDLGNVSLVSIGSKAIGAIVKSPVAIAKPATTKTWYRKVAVRAFNASSPLAGALPAVQSIGLIRPTPFTGAEVKLFTGATSAVVPHADGGGGNGDQTLTGPGGDQDNDGVPNTFDVDDNGNRTLDAVDPASSVTAAANPWSDIRFDYTGGGSSFNAGLSPAPTLTDVANAIGGDTGGHYGLWFFLDENTLKSAAGTTSNLDWVRVECGMLPYCGVDAEGYTPYGSQFGVMGELQSGFNEGYGSDPINWFWIQGGAYGCPVESGNGQFTRVDAGLRPTAPMNGMILACRNNGSGNIERIWNAMIRPLTGSSTLSKFSPGDVFTIQYKVHGDASLHTYTMTLAPYFLTVPGLVSLNGSTSLPTNTGDTIAPDSNGYLTMTFHRPQRAALPSEVNYSGTAATFMDIGGLHYGFIIGAENKEYGCSPASYSGLTGLNTDTPSSSGGSQWPTTDRLMTDRQIDAPNVSGAPDTLTLRVNLSQCLSTIAGNLGHSINMTNAYISLTAAGEFLTGGANRSTLMFRLATLTGSQFSGSTHY